MFPNVITELIHLCLMNILHIAIQPPLPTPLPRSCPNQGHGLRIFQKQNVQYQASYPVWRQVLLIFFVNKNVHYLHKVASIVSCIKPNASQWKATLHDYVRFPTVYRSIYRRNFFTLSNQMSHYIPGCIRITDSTLSWVFTIISLFMEVNFLTVCSGAMKSILLFCSLSSTFKKGLGSNWKTSNLYTPYMLHLTLWHKISLWDKISQNLAQLEGNSIKIKISQNFQTILLHLFYNEININHTRCCFTSFVHEKKKTLDYIERAPKSSMSKKISQNFVNFALSHRFWSTAYGMYDTLITCQKARKLLTCLQLS